MTLKYSISLSEYGLNTLVISFNKEPEIEIDLVDIFKEQNKNQALLQNLYVQINEYLATLTDDVQREIYNIFFKIYNNDYKQNYSDQSYVVKLEDNIAKVSELMNYNNFKTWIAGKESQMLIPEIVKDSYIYDPDMNTTQEKTYIRREYCDLIGLIIFIRALSPLYIDFYSYVKQITNHYYYKIFMLFVRSDIYNCPEIEKLKRYIEVNQQTLVGATKNEHLILTAGLSDDDILDSLIGEIIFNKLLTIDFFNKVCNIVSFIFQTIKYKGNFASSDGVAIRGKTTANDPNKDDISYFEDYRKTSDVPLGTVVEIQDALDNVQSLVNTLGYTDFDYALYHKELQNVQFLMDKGVDDVQKYLLGWFLSKIINPRALFYIELRKLVELRIFAKVVLLSRDQKFIAMLLSSYKDTEGGYYNVIMRNTLNKNTVARLAQSYTFAMEPEKQSMIEKTIMEISREIVNSTWVPVGTQDQLNGIVNAENYIDIPNNISDLICSFIEFVNAK